MLRNMILDSYKTPRSMFICSIREKPSLNLVTVETTTIDCYHLAEPVRISNLTLYKSIIIIQFTNVCNNKKIIEKIIITIPPPPK